ncbi:component of IIS longevity pathway SMK-1-domain containing protein [Nitzschia inconspicua]|uniref:Component of IIS longevity pathway SMK-1-domain containing protein n=1 Tax=Nitzschia inconspicua TaxID=303405 RepID=A0A9K3L243_9STRA|nr:component of IIS longevity pathway SMK-1-domain containing protein [Nitzschia inconspicua]
MSNAKVDMQQADDNGTMRKISTASGGAGSSTSTEPTTPSISQTTPSVKGVQTGGQTGGIINDAAFTDSPGSRQRGEDGVGAAFHMKVNIAARKRKRTGKTNPATSSPAATSGFDLEGNDDDDENGDRTPLPLLGNSMDIDNEDNDGFVDNTFSGSDDISSVVTAQTSNVTEKLQQQEHNNQKHHSYPSRNLSLETAPQKQQQHQATMKASGDETNSQLQQQQNQQPEGWRVKLYRLNADGSWDDCGTGRILCLYKPSEGTQHDENDDGGGDAWVYRELGEPTLCMHSEVSSTAGPQNATNTAPRILLRTRILLREAYQRQGENIITWCEPYLEEGNPAQGVDLALSFQDNAGCMDIWKQVTHVQARANELMRTKGKAGHSVADMARSIAAAHHANLQRQDQQELWANVASEASGKSQNHSQGRESGGDGCDQFEDSVSAIVNSYHDPNPGMSSITPHLPNPPTLSNLEEVADTIAAIQHVQQRESLAMFIAQNECAYLKSLLSLFPSAEEKGDYGSLATLAACVKTILLLNDPSIIELIVTEESIFEDICATLEYDPDLRDKANHRWFLRERVKFRTVALMEDEELISAIHRSFRVNYLRDTLLRPTMDESSLSTLSSLQTFTHADVVKGVTMSPVDDRGDLLRDSYLAKVIRILGRESDAICELEWMELEALPSVEDAQKLLKKRREEAHPDLSTVVTSGDHLQSKKMATIWKQHLAPQDESMASRRLRRRGSLSFLRELFNMVRVSLQQTDKDDFFAVLVSMEVDLLYDQDTNGKDPQSNPTKVIREEKSAKTQALCYSPQVSTDPVNLLSLLANVLADPGTDVSEKGSVLEIIAGIAMHDPSLIRRRCLDFYSSWESASDSGQIGPDKPRQNEKNHIIFRCPPNDLLASLLFLLAAESDAGVLLQASEIMRIILDTDIIGDQGPMNTGFADESEGIPLGAGLNPPHDQHSNPSGSGNTTSTEQNQFLLMFYNHYIPWLAAPFQHTVLFPILRVPTAIFAGRKSSPLLDRIYQNFQKGAFEQEPLLHLVPFSALRSSFAVELLSFCVRAHVYRMKTFLLRSTVFGKVMKLLKPSSLPRNASGERCLKLATLRFLRAVLSVNDDFYHRHIIQHDLFGHVFEAFRANPVGDNLVSSSIVEMCDYITTENIISLMEYIVTKHLFSVGTETSGPSLEDVSSPYVSTLTALREAYEKLLREKGDHSQQIQGLDPMSETSAPAEDAGRIVMNEKALEDQRKFREEAEDESYFESDD